MGEANWKRITPTTKAPAGYSCDNMSMEHAGLARTVARATGRRCGDQPPAEGRVLSGIAEIPRGTAKQLHQRSAVARTVLHRKRNRGGDEGRREGGAAEVAAGGAAAARAPDAH